MNVIKVITSYLALNVFNTMFFENLTRNKNIIGDVEDIHFNHVKNIYENSYFYSMNNSNLEGYPQLVAYFQALLNRISINLDEFEHLASSVNVLYFLGILFIFDSDLHNRTKYLGSFLFTSIIFNSEWLKLLFVDSLMMEGSLSYFFCVALTTLTFCIKNKHSSLRLVFFIFGILYLSKQFISILSLIFVIFFLITKSTRRFAFYGLFGVVLKEVSYGTYFSNLIKNYHFKQFDLTDAILELLLFRNLKFLNIKQILINLYLDKPLTLLFLYFFLFIFLLFLMGRLRNHELNIFIFAIILNFLFIFILYISVWKNMELESPIRYMLNLLHLNIYAQLKMIDISDD